MPTFGWDGTMVGDPMGARVVHRFYLVLACHVIFTFGLACEYKKETTTVVDEFTGVILEDGSLSLRPGFPFLFSGRKL